MTSVGICPVFAEGGHFKGLSLQTHGDRAVLQAGGDGMRRKQRRHFLGSGGGGHVPVDGRFAPQQIAHAATHRIRLVSGLLQSAQHLVYGGRKHGNPSFFAK